MYVNLKFSAKGIQMLTVKMVEDFNGNPFDVQLRVE